MGPPCASWVWISRSRSKRTAQEPLGDCSQAFVRSGNAVAEVVANIIRICNKKNFWFVIEQPATSLFFRHPCVRAALLEAPHQVVKLEMGRFGGQSAKPTILTGSAPWLHRVRAIAQDLPSRKHEYQSLVLRRGGRVTGIKRRLENSAQYPFRFCDTVVRLHLAEQGLHREVMLLCLVPALSRRGGRHFSMGLAEHISDFIWGGKA